MASKRPLLTLTPPHYKPNISTLTATTWNTQLKDLSKQSQFTEALSLFRQMLRSSSTPNAFTFPFALKSCAALSLPINGQQLHCHVIKSGCNPEPFVLTSLITMYCKCRLIQYARKVFDETHVSLNLTVCYNAMISGYASNSMIYDAVFLFRKMIELGVEVNSVTALGLVPCCGSPEYFMLGWCLHGCCMKVGLVSDCSVTNCLLTMYVKCGSVEFGRRLFDEMDERGLITWNAMISGYAQNGLATDVLELYEKMELCRVVPDPVTLVGVLSSCAHLGAHSIGRKVEKRIHELGFGSNFYLDNALINMYARCGNLVKAHSIFDAMPMKTVVSWTGIIGGYGMHGKGEVAIELFDKMIASGIMPDKAAFVCVLSACSHAGLTCRGLDYFSAMERKYRIQPGPEHLSCMVDLLGRAGRLGEALDLIKSTKVKPDGAVWGALLGACKIHKNVELAELAFEHVIELEPTNIGYYVLLFNIYSDVKNLEGIIKVRVMMRERKLKKQPGYSYVEQNSRVHLFLAGDRRHPQTQEIYNKLEELENLVNELDGSRKSDRERSEELVVGVHSEKLAIVFGLLNTMPETEIVIIKNLRICENCHRFMKLVSKIVARQFVIRDATRFHHFTNGKCSCKDYW
ncbi:hypothetical protein ACFE04_002291 [Oxalis oulophora]